MPIQLSSVSRLLIIRRMIHANPPARWGGFLLGVLAMLLAVPLARAERAPEKPTVVKLTVPPVATPTLALKYRLFPTRGEMAAGDAAPICREIFAHFAMSWETFEAADDLCKLPRIGFSKDRARQILEPYRPMLRQIHAASRKTQCEWNIPLDWMTRFDARKMNFTAARQITVLLCIAARLEQAKGHPDEALQTLQDGFAFARQFTNDANVVQALIGIGLLDLLLDCVSELQQDPACGNLYWALTELPHPLIDFGAIAEVEQATCHDFLPTVDWRANNTVTSDQFIANIARATHSFDARVDQYLMLQVMAVAPARVYLRSQGFTQDQIDHMPIPQTVGIYLIETFQRVFDEEVAAARLPYWQAEIQFDRIEVEISRLNADVHNPLLNFTGLIPGSMKNLALLERRIAMMRNVEALRAYAASHKGVLPASLAELTDTPAAR